MPLKTQLVLDLRRLSDDSNEEQKCIVCYRPTICILLCCKTICCDECYIEWLKKKRQCMICKEDQCSFEHWMKHYYIPPEDEEPSAEFDFTRSFTGAFQTALPEDHEYDFTGAFRSAQIPNYFRQPIPVVEFEVTFATFPGGREYIGLSDEDVQRLGGELNVVTIRVPDIPDAQLILEETLRERFRGGYRHTPESS